MLITDKDLLECFYSSHRIWQGIPGIARTKNGRTFVSFYSGNVEENYGNFAAVITSDNDHDFSEPIIVAKKEGNFRCFDPVLWIDPLDRLWFIWNVMPGEEVYASICKNPDAEVLNWSEEFYVGRGIMMNKPTVLTSGEWLFPIAVWRSALFYGLRKISLAPDEQFGAFAYKTSDNGKTFLRMGMADIRDRAFDEHMILELNNGALKMFVRTSYGIGAAYSYDRGKNWSSGEDTKLGGPCSRFFIRRLRSGRILLINHVNFTGRNNLTALLSEDDGNTFPYSLLLDGRNDVSYPDALECDDGYIYVVYDRERGAYKTSLEQVYGCAREILTAKITEEDIIHGQLVSSGSYLQNVASRLGRLSEEDPDPFDQPIPSIESIVDQFFEENTDTDILQKVFSRFPLNCINIAHLDFNKFDYLLEDFCKSGCKDKVALMKLILLLRSTPTVAPNSSPIIDTVSAYIQTHLGEEMFISEIAEKMKISIYYLTHLFKSVTGITMVEYRNEMRMTAAKQMLISTNKTIKDIAIECGYNSASYFSELFSRSEKISPTEFRKYHQLVR